MKNRTPRIRQRYSTYVEGSHEPTTYKTGYREDFLTLYPACRDISKLRGGLVLANAGTNKLIAFWCEHTNTVRPGFAANEREREAIIDYRL